MKVYDPDSLKYKDRLAEKRRRAFIFKFLFFIGLFIAGIGLIFHLLFFSGLLDIKDITLNGLDKVDGEAFNGKLKKQLDSKWLGLIEKQKNIVFFSPNSFKAEIISNFPEIKEISVSKKMPHSLSVNIVERKTAGIWCFGPPTGGCKYFDKEGVTWGEAAKSSGFLILNIDDLRKDTQTIDKDLLNNFMFIVQQLKESGILISKFTIPEDFFGDFRSLTSRGYELVFSTDSNIKEQLEVFKIFLKGKQGEIGFQPQYIDLRINGRIYYK